MERTSRQLIGARSSEASRIGSSGAAVYARAFSLVEMIGVLAIIAILAALIIPRVVSQYDRAAWVRETGDQAGISNALVMAILSSKTIPDASGWANAVATQMPLPPSSITNTPRGIARYMMVDPNLRINGTGLPYSQTSNLGATNQPTALRLMVLSTIANPLNAADLASGNFNTIWNTPDGQTPAGWTWTGNGDDLRIQRINLAPIFHRLKLVNQSPLFVGKFGIENYPSNSVPTDGNGWDSYYLHGTYISLRDSNGNEQARHILTGDVSFVYEWGVWKGQISSGVKPLTLGATYGIEVNNFIAAGPPFRSADPAKYGGVSPEAAVMAINSFMEAYTAWANVNPCFNYWNAVNATNVSFWNILQTNSMLIDRITGNGTYTNSLLIP
jgi:type II secretory pathway pseudopilin PulG